MKTYFFAVALLLAVILSGTRDVQAQAYGGYDYGSYWDEIRYQEYLLYLQQYDPYYELHVMHYQLYSRPYQPYPVYEPCCYSGALIVPQWSTSINPPPQFAITPSTHAPRRR